MALTAKEYETLTDMIQAIDAEKSHLSDWERGFFDDQVTRIEKYGTETFFSPKQWGVMRKMLEKVTGDRGDEPPPADEDDYGQEEDRYDNSD